MSAPSFIEPAFPSQEYNADGSPATLSVGMSLRDWFAGKALAGWIANSPTIAGENLNGTADHAGRIAEISYRYADAMLRAREAKP